MVTDTLTLWRLSIKLILRKSIDSIWFDTEQLINSTNTPVFYFYAKKCKQDIEQHERIKNGKNVYSFAFFSKRHGATVFPFNWPYILNKSLVDMVEMHNRYKGKVILPSCFAFKSLPIKDFILYWPGYISKYWTNKVIDKSKMIIKRLLKVKK